MFNIIMHILLFYIMIFFQVSNLFNFQFTVFGSEFIIKPDFLLILLVYLSIEKEKWTIIIATFFGTLFLSYFSIYYSPILISKVSIAFILYIYNFDIKKHSILSSAIIVLIVSFLNDLIYIFSFKLISNYNLNLVNLKSTLLIKTVFNILIFLVLIYIIYLFGYVFIKNRKSKRYKRNYA